MGTPVYKRNRGIPVVKKWAKVALMQKDAAPKEEDHLENLLEELYHWKQLHQSQNLLSSRYLAHVSHELRTPLQVIDGVSRLLNDRLDGSSIQDQLDMLSSSVDMMTRLVEELLDETRLKTGKIQVRNEIVDLYEIVDEVKLLFADKCSSKGVTLNINVSPTIDRIISIDKKLILQILTNLIGNAVKFTDQGSVSVHWNQEESKTQKSMILTVKDTGIGIPNDRLPYIFENFTQANDMISYQYGGYGIGLSIVKNIVDGLDGEIKVTSEVNRGTIFTVKVPFNKDLRIYNHNQIINRAENSNLESLTSPVMIIEDDYLHTKYLETMLSKWNITFSAFDCGVEALEKLHHQNYGLVLMDLNGKGLDGNQLLKSIQEVNPLVPIVIVSGASIEEIDDEIGNHTFLSKPYSPNDLKAAICTSQLLFVDQEVLGKYYENDIEYQTNIFEIFKKVVPEKLLACKAGIKNNDRDKVEKLLHQLMSNYQAVGLINLSSAVSRLKKSKQVNLQQLEELENLTIKAISELL